MRRGDRDSPCGEVWGGARGGATGILRGAEHGAGRWGEAAGIPRRARHGVGCGARRRGFPGGRETGQFYGENLGAKACPALPRAAPRPGGDKNAKNPHLASAGPRGGRRIPAPLATIVTHLLAECICDDGVRRVDNFMKLSTSIKTLRDKKIRDLFARESDIRAKLEIEEKQGKQPLEEVTLWLTRVVEVKPKVEAAITTYEQRGDDNCFVRLRQLLDLAETVGEELNKEVDELLGKEFKDGLVIEQLPAEANMLNSLPSLLNQSKTKEKLLVEMMRLLKDSKVGKLGAYGMEGVGKPTIMKTMTTLIFLLISYTLIDRL
ncbi:hypothetical protein Sjap_025508 [Stephania japonica]|uniref:Uncharacterized protein n=1 Tax=Stephania japonica TaxID=461633 RepID=A0AAP0E696_9MAGN